MCVSKFGRGIFTYVWAAFCSTWSAQCSRVGHTLLYIIQPNNSLHCTWTSPYGRTNASHPGRNSGPKYPGSRRAYSICQSRCFAAIGLLISQLRGEIDRPGTSSSCCSWKHTLLINTLICMSQPTQPVIFGEEKMKVQKECYVLFKGLPPVGIHTVTICISLLRGSAAFGHFKSAQSVIGRKPTKASVGTSPEPGDVLMVMTVGPDVVLVQYIPPIRIATASSGTVHQDNQREEGQEGSHGGLRITLKHNGGGWSLFTGYVPTHPFTSHHEYSGQANNRWLDLNKSTNEFFFHRYDNLTHLL